MFKYDLHWFDLVTPAQWMVDTGEHYESPLSLVEDYNPNGFFDNMFSYLHKMSRYELSTEFVLAWMKTVVVQQALFKAEEAYQTYMASVTEQDKKKMGKVYKQADLVYTKAYDEYYGRFYNE